MSVLSLIIVLALCITEICQMPSMRIWEAFLIVIGYWVGRGTKVRDDVK